MFVVADNINPMNASVVDAMTRRDSAPVAAIARQCGSGGADFIDINPGRLSPRKREQISFLIETVQDSCDCGLILDSPDIDTIKAGLISCHTTPIISAVTIEPVKLQSFVSAALEYNAKLVALLTGDNGMPPSTTEEKIEIALRIYDYALSEGLDISRLIFDPVIPHASWPDLEKHVSSCVDTIRLLSDGSIFGVPVHTMAGLSNLFSGINLSSESMNSRKKLFLVLKDAGLEYFLLNIKNINLI